MGEGLGCTASGKTLCGAEALKSDGSAQTRHTLSSQHWHAHGMHLAISQRATRHTRTMFTPVAEGVGSQAQRPQYHDWTLSMHPVNSWHCGISSNTAHIHHLCHVEPVDPVQSTLKRRHLLALYTMSTKFAVLNMSIGISFIAHRFIASLSFGRAVASPNMPVLWTGRITCKCT